MTKMNLMTTITIAAIVLISHSVALCQDDLKNFEDAITLCRKYVAATHEIPVIKEKSSRLQAIESESRIQKKLISPYEVVQLEQIISTAQAGYLEGCKDAIEILEVSIQRPSRNRQQPVQDAQNMVAWNSRTKSVLEKAILTQQSFIRDTEKWLHSPNSKIRIDRLKQFRSKLGFWKNAFITLRNENNRSDRDPDTSDLLSDAEKLVRELEHVAAELAFNSSAKNVPALLQNVANRFSSWKSGYWEKDYASSVLRRKISIGLASPSLGTSIETRNQRIELIQDEVIPKIEEFIRTHEQMRRRIFSNLTDRSTANQLTKYVSSLAIEDSLVGEMSGNVGVAKNAVDASRLVFCCDSTKYDMYAIRTKRAMEPVAELSCCKNNVKLWVSQGQVFLQVGLHRFKLTPRQKSSDSKLRRELDTIKKLIEESINLEPFIVIANNAYNPTSNTAEKNGSDVTNSQSNSKANDTTFPVEINQPIPPFSVSTFDKKTKITEDLFKDRTVLLNFWSWEESSSVEFAKSLKHLRKISIGKRNKLRLLHISVSGSRRHLDASGWQGYAGSMEHEMVKRFGVENVPALFLVSNGKIKMVPKEFEDAMKKPGSNLSRIILDKLGVKQ